MAELTLSQIVIAIVTITVGIILLFQLGLFSGIRDSFISFANQSTPIFFTISIRKKFFV